MARRSALRASDGDRERVVERLRHATGEGRLLAEELEERLGAAFSARTYGELDALVSDLPAPRDDGRHGSPLWVKATIALAIVMAAIAVLALVAFIVIGVAGAWLLWMLFAWTMFGRRARHGPWGHSRTRARAGHRATAGARAPRGRAASSL
jgi:membrane-associated protease RseP (regulator of RpoE activity)